MVGIDLLPHMMFNATRSHPVLNSMPQAPPLNPPQPPHDGQQKEFPAVAKQLRGRWHNIAKLH